MAPQQRQKQRQRSAHAEDEQGAPKRSGRSSATTKQAAGSAKAMKQKVTSSKAANGKSPTAKPAATSRAAAKKSVGSKRKTSATASDKPTPAQAPAKRVRNQAPPKLEVVTHSSHRKVPADLFVWGDGGCGQLGLGEDEVEKLRPFPLLVEGKKVLQVACGGMHTVVLTQDGQVYTWGVNDEGALGRETEGELWEKSPAKQGAMQPSDVPVHVPIPDPVVQITSGDSHTCALTALGSVYSWGTFRDAGGVMGFTDNERIQLLPALVYAAKKPDEQLVQISSGADHVWGLTAHGRVLSWGNGQQGQLGRVGQRLNDRSKLHTLLTPQEVPIKRKKGVTSRVREVSCGTYDAFVVLENGILYACGLNNYGQLGLPALEPVFALMPVPGLDNVLHVKPGQHHTLVLLKDGTVLAFGRGTYGRLGRSNVDVAADDPLPDPQPVDGLDGVQAVGLAAGLAVSGCYTAEGAAYLWGFGSNSQLARGDNDDDAELPCKLANTKRLQGMKVTALEFGGQHAALLAVPGQVEPVAPSGDKATANVEQPTPHEAIAEMTCDGVVDDSAKNDEGTGGEADGDTVMGEKEDEANNDA